jgi:hypothetical protein
MDELSSFDVLLTNFAAIDFIWQKYSLDSEALLSTLKVSNASCFRAR